MNMCTTCAVVISRRIKYTYNKDLLYKYLSRLKLKWIKIAYGSRGILCIEHNVVLTRVRYCYGILY